jgi:uncharacterized damage-inducible protein DinB
MPMNAPLIQNEPEGLLGFLDHQRQAVRYAVYGLSEEQARRRPTASELSLGGLVKHLLYGECTWADRLQGQSVDEDAAFERYLASFVLEDDETLADLLQQYQAAAARTDAILAGIDDLGQRVPLPVAPWYPDPEGCTVRWIALHLIEETARHAGHADLLREALDQAQSGPLMAAAEGWPADGWVQPWQPAS